LAAIRPYVTYARLRTGTLSKSGSTAPPVR
jgi:hypothetical protein